MKKLFTSLITFVMFAVLAVPALHSSAAADSAAVSSADSASAVSADFNILVYMIGSDLETKDSAATNDLMEMIDGAKNMDSRINLIVYAGGALNWHNDIFSDEENRCVRIGSGGAELLYADEAKCMTDPETLRGFLRYCTENYPAKRNMIIFWDHGGGGFRGFGEDELYPYSGPMNIMDIHSVLSETGVVYDIVGFDACMMAGIETAIGVCDSGRFMVASQESEPCGGWDYDSWLPALVEDPGMNTETLCRKIADTYIDACKKMSLYVNCTMSVTDLDQVCRNVPDALSEFSRELLESISNKQFNIVKTQKALNIQFIKANGSDMMDAVTLAENLGGEKGKRFVEVLNDAVIYNNIYPEKLNDHGLSIYVPIKNNYDIGEYHDVAVSQLRDMGVNAGYIDWATCITQYMNALKKGMPGARTFFDVINGTTDDAFTLSVMAAVRESMAIEAQGYISTDSNGIPHLVMSDEEKEYCMWIYQTFGIEKEEGFVEYGQLCYAVDDFPIEQSGFWMTIGNGWLAVNGTVCPFYMEDQWELENGSILLQGYTLMNCSGEYGWLYLDVIYNDNDGTITVEPECFQAYYVEEDSSLCDRLSYVSELDSNTEIFFYRDSIDHNDMITLEPTTGVLHWGDGINFEWKTVSSETFQKVVSTYEVVDIFCLSHELENRVED